ncbi:hypothetical protein PFUGPA_01637 [Plasmodium falciparum Palo Alto/Uganda]|uniref:Acetyl-coenzyme A transporter 1 n=1 Tax=Plasmodium falciparum (isolate Palo Alto / Uganda) TaxID=57270 RepID=W4J4C7_PLAFP|nr:hypothetical protein PFUGPA_01637 [Plasmodium falciparum Palo Alto/Uganda]
MFNRLFENFEYNFFIKRKKLKYDTKDGQYVKQNISKRNKDYYNIIFLLSLYTIQGVPIGVSSVVPLIIQDKVSYSQLSILSLVSIPFSIKLLWAPIVDSVYNKRIGRRKSWIIPLQWSTIFLWLLDYTDKEFCYKGKCVLVDGFYIQMILSFIVGIIINKYILSFTRKLQAFPLEDWRTKYIGKEF